MKKIFFAIAIVLMMGIGANAQYFNSGSDNFFNDWNDVSNGLDRDPGYLPTLPGSHGWNDDVNAPLGSGLLILTALGAGYALKKRHEE